jgi:hypothetical protein
MKPLQEHLGRRKGSVMGPAPRDAGGASVDKESAARRLSPRCNFKWSSMSGECLSRFGPSAAWS